MAPSRKKNRPPTAREFLALMRLRKRYVAVRRAYEQRLFAIYSRLPKVRGAK
jgi:hypothetical protein